MARPTNRNHRVSQLAGTYTFIYEYKDTSIRMIGNAVIPMRLKHFRIARKLMESNKPKPETTKYT